MGPRLCMNYDTGDYEWIDEYGYSWDRGEYVFNWDRSVFDDDDDEDEDYENYDDDDDDW